MKEAAEVYDNIGSEKDIRLDLSNYHELLANILFISRLTHCQVARNPKTVMSYSLKKC